jgi:uncharacterized Zn finger protein
MKPKKCQHYFDGRIFWGKPDEITVTCHDCGAVYIGKITWRKKRVKG